MTLPEGVVTLFSGWLWAGLIVFLRVAAMMATQPQPAG